MRLREAETKFPEIGHRHRGRLLYHHRFIRPPFLSCCRQLLSAYCANTKSQMNKGRWFTVGEAQVDNSCSQIAFLVITKWAGKVCHQKRKCVILYFSTPFSTLHHTTNYFYSFLNRRPGDRSGRPGISVVSTYLQQNNSRPPAVLLLFESIV